MAAAPPRLLVTLYTNHRNVDWDRKPLQGFNDVTIEAFSKINLRKQQSPASRIPSKLGRISLLSTLLTHLHTLIFANDLTMDSTGGNKTVPHLMVLTNATLENDTVPSDLADMESLQITLNTTQNDPPYFMVSNADQRHPLSGLEEPEAFSPIKDVTGPLDDLEAATQALCEDDDPAAPFEWLYDDLEEHTLASPDENTATEWFTHPPPGLPHPPQYKHDLSSDEGSPNGSVQDEFEDLDDPSYDDFVDFDPTSPLNVARSPSPAVAFGSPFAQGEFTFRYSVHREETPLSPLSTKSGDTLGSLHNDPSASPEIGKVLCAFVESLLRKEPAALSCLEECLDLVVPFETGPSPLPSPVRQTFPSLRGSFDRRPISEPVSRCSSPEVAELLLEFENYTKGLELDNYKKRVAAQLSLNFDYTSKYPPLRPVRVFIPPPREPEDLETSSASSSPLDNTRVLLEAEVTPEMQSVKEMIDTRLGVRALQGRKERNLIFYNSDATSFPYPTPIFEDILRPALDARLSPEDPHNLFKMPDGHDRFLAGLAAKARVNDPLRHDACVDFTPTSPPSEPTASSASAESERPANMFPFAPEMVSVKPGFQALMKRHKGHFEFNRPTYSRPSGSRRKGGEGE